MKLTGDDMKTLQYYKDKFTDNANDFDSIMVEMFNHTDEQRQKDFRAVIEMINEYYGFSQSRLILKEILIEKVEATFFGDS